MAQVNKYSDRASYAADPHRLSARSAVSYIESDNEVICDGVNVLVGKAWAGPGDLAVYDRTQGVLRFLRSATLAAERLASSLTPLAVVYGRRGLQLLLVSLDDARWDGSSSIRWAHSYEVALGGFDPGAGGELVLRINGSDLSFRYAAGSSLEEIAAQLAAHPAVGSCGWTAAADPPRARIVLSSNTWSPAYAVIEAVRGCELTRTTEDRNYQTSLTGLLIPGRSAEHIRRNNRIDTSSAGCNFTKFSAYYSVNGSTAAGLKPGSGEILRESLFTQADNPQLFAAYASYGDYLRGEHLLQYPAACGAMLRDGKKNTHLIGPLRFEDIRGLQAPCYPAAAAALEYGVRVEGAVTGLEPGAWWLPSVEELHLLLRDRALSSADAERDPVNRTLLRLGRTPCYGSGAFRWTSCEYIFSNAFFYHGTTGNMDARNKHYALSVRPVTIL